MKIDNFFAELKRRNVVRMAGLYLVGAWLLTQVASTVLPMFGAPDWLPRSIVSLLAIGFVPALIFSWVFELTPQGLKRDEDVPPEESIAPQTARRMNRMIIAVLVLALGYFAFDKFVLTPRRDAALVAATEKSVAARPSAFSFKGKNATAQEIGQKLGVAHLVEGSVRKAGDVVRIAARLTRADTGEQLWSENFTRDLKDVFAVQTELAQTIVGQLSGQLTNGAADPEAKAAIRAQVQAAEKGGTKNVEAHQHYLQGRFYSNRHSEKSAGEALAEYRRAVELDPSFGLAWAGLAQTHVWYCNFSTQGLEAFDAHLARAREAAARALAIEPNLPEALRVRAVIQLNFDFDWKGASETLRTALSLAHADPALLTDAGTLAVAKGDTARGIALYREAVALDPVNPRARSYLASTLALAGQFAEAQVEYAQLVELSPASPMAHAGLGDGFLVQGKFEEAVTAAKDDAAEWARLLVVAMARWSQKRIPESDAALARLIESSADTAAYQIAEVYAYRGD